MFKLMELPYAQDALEPYISAKTISYHYDKHHKGYVDKLNKALAEAGDIWPEDVTLEHLITHAEGTLYDLAAQVWNHQFYWLSLSPQGGGQPPASVEKFLKDHFGSTDDFLAALKKDAASEFGSGWAWLVKTGDGDIKTISSTDAVNPMRNGHTPLLTVDVWEHAYYLDYQNERGSYLDAVLKNLINWDFLQRNLA